MTQIERGDMSTQDVKNRFVAAPGGGSKPRVKPGHRDEESGATTERLQS